MNSSRRVRLIVDSSNQSWILGKFARRLAEHLPQFGLSAEVGSEPDPGAEVNHWLLYLHPWMSSFREAGFYSGARDFRLSPSTMLITHVDDPIKVRVLHEVFERVVDHGICLSHETRSSLIAEGFEGERLSVITPGHDASVHPRRIVIGITSRVYPDGRKREGLLTEVARAIRLDRFRFEIFGSGWDAIIPTLRAAGAEVEFDSGSDDAEKDYEKIRTRLPHFDYYLYTGWDEGSMGFLDAVAAGIRTIVTPQGFHLDIDGGITHPFETGEDLVRVFQGIETSAWPASASRAPSWADYARAHAELWLAMLEGRRSTGASASQESAKVTPAGSPAVLRRQQHSLKQALRSDLCGQYLESRRFLVRGILSRWKRRLFGFLGGHQPA